MVELDSTWEKDIELHSSEIETLLKLERLDSSQTYQHCVALNKLSAVTKKGKYWIIVFSLFKKSSIKIDGDDLWLIENGLKKFSNEQRQILRELLA